MKRRSTTRSTTATPAVQPRLSRRPPIRCWAECCRLPPTDQFSERGRHTPSRRRAPSVPDCRPKPGCPRSGPRAERRPIAGSPSRRATREHRGSCPGTVHRRSRTRRTSRAFAAGSGGNADRAGDAGFVRPLLGRPRPTRRGTLLDRPPPVLAYPYFDTPQLAFDRVIQLAVADVPLAGEGARLVSAYAGPRHLARLLRHVADGLEGAGVAFTGARRCRAAGVAPLAAPSCAHQADAVAQPSPVDRNSFPRRRVVRGPRSADGRRQDHLVRAQDCGNAQRRPQSNIPRANAGTGRPATR